MARHIWHKHKSTRIALAVAGFIAFLVVTIATGASVFFQYTIFATEERAFSIHHIQTEAVDKLLATSFYCPSSLPAFVCYTDEVGRGFMVFLLCAVAAVTLAVWHRRVRKKLRWLVFFLLPLVLFVTITILARVPVLVVAQLTANAKEEIQSSSVKVQTPEARLASGIVDDIASIAAILKKHNTVPTYYEYLPLAEATYHASGVTHEDKDTLYRAVILPQTAYHEFPSSTAPFDAVLFPNNVLIVGTSTGDLVQHLAPAVAHTILSASYSAHLKATPPTITVLSEKEYNEVLARKAEEYKQRLAATIADIKAAIREVEAFIAYASGIKNNSRYRASIEADIAEAQQYLSQYRWALSSHQEAYAEFERNPITPEFQSGIFTPPKSIHIKFYDKENVPFASYLAVTLHELLHYEDGGSTRDIPLVLEEGITDYLTTRLIEQFMTKQAAITFVPTYEGYPEFINFIEHLLMRIPEQTFVEEYFHRNEPGIKKLVDTYYDAKTYDQFIQKTDQLYYLGNKKEGRDTLIADIEALLDATPSSEKKK